MCMRMRLCRMCLRLCWWWSLIFPCVIFYEKYKLILNKLKFQNRSKILPSSGLFHFDIRSHGDRSRVHLRVDPDGSGLLIINASRIIHLNPTALFMAYLFLQKTKHEQAINIIIKTFDVPKALAESDYTQTSNQLQELIKPDGVCPIHDLNIDITPPFSATPSAPYRMDLALSYRCNNDCSHCYNARSREYPELTTKEWLWILDLLWDIGIPHIVFTGGEPTLRSDLPDLISHAEKNGQITGINTNGRRLSDPKYVDALVDAGLDHVQITLESHDPAIHDDMVNSRGAWTQTAAGIRNVLESSLYVMTNTTMLTKNSPMLKETLEFLANLGVPTIGLNALIYSGRGLSVDTGLAENELQSLLTLAREITSIHSQQLIWYTPTQYCNFDPVQLELGIKSCTAARYNMCIEPNGDVIPCQSYYVSLGNILKLPWARIWDHELSKNLRGRLDIPQKCTDCALVSECRGGCPLALSHMT
jgi:radical SAM protein with 4Fe4S-binding SPASM domain